MSYVIEELFVYLPYNFVVSSFSDVIESGVHIYRVGRGMSQFLVLPPF